MSSLRSPSPLATELQRVLTCHQSEFQNTSVPDVFPSEPSIPQVSSSRMPTSPEVQSLPSDIPMGPEGTF